MDLPVMTSLKTSFPLTLFIIFVLIYLNTKSDRSRPRSSFFAVPFFACRLFLAASYSWL